MGNNPVSYPGRGTTIGFSVLPLASPPVYVLMPQLEKFDRSGSKTETDDVTCLDTPGNNKTPAPVVVDNGKYTAEGVYDPQNPNIVVMQGYQQNMTQLGYQITLVDGTTLTGLCYVTQFEAPKIDRYKRNRFSFEVDIFGVETLVPQGASAIPE
jgi:hypothetical protein